MEQTVPLNEKNLTRDRISGFRFLAIVAIIHNITTNWQLDRNLDNSEGQNQAIQRFNTLWRQNLTSHIIKQPGHGRALRAILIHNTGIVDPCGSGNISPERHTGH
jgi:hypothetical protein